MKIVGLNYHVDVFNWLEDRYDISLLYSTMMCSGGDDTQANLWLLLKRIVSEQ